MNRMSMYELLDLDEQLTTSQLLREHVPDAFRYLVDRRVRLVAVIKQMRDAESEGSPLPNVGQEHAPQTDAASTVKYRARPVGQRRMPFESPTVIAEGRCNRCDGPWQLLEDLLATPRHQGRIHGHRLCVRPRIWLGSAVSDMHPLRCARQSYRRRSNAWTGSPSTC